MGLGFGFGFGYTPKTHTQKTQKIWVKPKTHTQKPKFFGFIPKTHTQKTQKNLGLGKNANFLVEILKKIYKKFGQRKQKGSKKFTAKNFVSSTISLKIWCKFV